MAANSNLTTGYFAAFPVRKLKRLASPFSITAVLLDSALCALLGLAGLYSIQTGLWAATARLSSFNRMPLYRLRHAIDQRFQNYKTTKALVAILAIIIGAIIGALLSPFLLSQLPQYTLALTTFLNLFGTSLTFSILINFAVGYVLRFLPEIINLPALVGVNIALVNFPIQLPLQLESLFVCMTLSAFALIQISKQATRAYNYFYYNDTNADGYGTNKSKDELNLMYQKIANTFNQTKEKDASDVTKEDVENLLTVCRKGVRGVKERISLGNKFTGSYTQLTHAIKNIHHGVRDITPENHHEVRDMLQAATQTTSHAKHFDTTGYYSCFIQEYTKQYVGLENARMSQIYADRHLHGLFFRQGLEAACSKFKSKQDSYTSLPKELADACAKFVNNPSNKT